MVESSTEVRRVPGSNPMGGSPFSLMRIDEKMMLKVWMMMRVIPFAYIPPSRRGGGNTGLSTLDAKSAADSPRCSTITETSGRRRRENCPLFPENRRGDWLAIGVGRGGVRERLCAGVGSSWASARLSFAKNDACRLGSSDADGPAAAGSEGRPSGDGK